MNFAVIGYGAIGKERVRALLRIKRNTEHFDPKLVENIYVHDIKEPMLEWGATWVEHENDERLAKCEWVFICLPHYLAKQWVKKVAPNFTGILLEKPYGMTAEDAREMEEAVMHSKQLYVGFNYRFFGGIKRLEQQLRRNAFGKIISVNMICGHGGSPEDVKSWKLNPAFGAPDALLDPGIHLIDLLKYLFPLHMFNPEYATYWGDFWKTGVKEEVHCMLKSDGGFMVNLQSSIVKWKSTFRVEVNGTEGYGIVTGKGKSYGTQVYTGGERWSWTNGLSQSENEEVFSYPNCGDSFYEEVKSLLGDRRLNCTSGEAFNDMVLYQQCKYLLDKKSGEL